MIDTISGILAVVVTILVGWAGWWGCWAIIRKKIYPPLSTLLLFLTALVLSLVTYFHSPGHDAISNSGTIVDTIRGVAVIVALLCVHGLKELKFSKTDKWCFGITGGIVLFWLSIDAPIAIFSLVIPVSVAANIALQGILVAGYVPTYKRVAAAAKTTESLGITLVGLAAGVCAHVLAVIRGDILASIHTGRAILMVTFLIFLILRAHRREWDAQPMRHGGGYRAYRVHGTSKTDPAWSEIESYVLHWIRNPEKGSTFDKRTRLFRNWLPTPILLWVMRMLRYDGILLIGPDGRTIVHCFWQAEHVFRWWRRHVDRFHMFSATTREDMRLRGWASTVLASHFVRYAFGQYERELGVIGVRLGAGGTEGSDNPSDWLGVYKVYCKIVSGQLRLPDGIEVVDRGGGHLDFINKEVNTR